jgi:hypothetical protein
MENSKVKDTVFSATVATVSLVLIAADAAIRAADGAIDTWIEIFKEELTNRRRK